MTPPRERLRIRCQWRWLWDSPLLVATWSAVMLALVALAEVAAALRRADAVRVQTSQALAQVAAEAVAMQLPLAPAAPPPNLEVGGVGVMVAPAPGGWQLTATVPDGEAWTFHCDSLPGGASPAFGWACAATDPALAQWLGGRCVAPADLPRLERRQVQQATRADANAAFRRDPGVALLHLPAGTERDDYVFAPRSATALAGLDLVVVPGHLWIEPGTTRLALDHDLVVVVQGNLYAVGSLQLVGPGRLLLATTADGVGAPFADLDGDGRWSAGDRLLEGAAFQGPVEGAGSAWLGLPGRRDPVHCGAGLAVAGELHVAAPAAVDGVLVLPHGVTRLGSPAPELRPRGERVYCPGRERVAGFAPVGAPRPGLLRPASPGPGQDGEETLYLAAPAR